MNAIEKYQRKPTPLEAAKLVARECYAWPGGYALTLVMEDGGALCPDCVRSEFRLIVAAARDPRYRTGWEPAGYQIEEAPESDIICDHCGSVIAERAS